MKKKKSYEAPPASLSLSGRLKNRRKRIEGKDKKNRRKENGLRGNAEKERKSDCVPERAC